MKKSTHIIYFLIISLLLAFIYLRKPVENERKLEKEISWTYGIDYSNLSPVEELGPELADFLDSLRLTITNHDWDQFIQACYPDHYKAQQEIFFEDYPDEDFPKATYVSNNLVIRDYHPLVNGRYNQNFFVKNKLPNSDHKDEFFSLNQIKDLWIVGYIANEREENYFSCYGYVRLNNQIIHALKLDLLKEGQDYYVIGAYG